MSRARARNVLGWTWAVSIALHVGAIAGFGWVALRSIAHGEASAAPRPRGDGTIAVELPGVAEGTLIEDHVVDPKGDPPRYFGGSSEAQLDQKRTGRGGAPTAEENATNLSDRDERIHRTQDIQGQLELDQQQRLRTGRARHSWEDRRSSKDPMELTFLASGDGARAERPYAQPVDPSRGGARPDSASVLGGTAGERERVDGADEPGATLGAELDGARTSAPGLGVHDGRVGTDHRSGAHVMRARPDVVLAAVSIPAMRHGRPRDDIDSDQEVSKTLRSIVHASTAAGAPGSDTGGTSGGGDPGAGGASGPVRPRARSAPATPSGGTSTPATRASCPTSAACTRSSTRSGGMRSRSRPRSISSRGPSSWRSRSPRTVGSRSRGLRSGRAASPSSNRNCYEAVLRAAPFDPIPATLGVSELHVKMPFDARNPIVK